MSIRAELNRELARLIGFTGSQRVTVADPSGLQMTVEFTAVDLLGCMIAEIEVSVPRLHNAAFDVLRKWADALSKRITYLLEQIGPLEYDPAAGQVLIRSAPPDTLPDGTQYYEVVLSSQSGGNFLLKRYRSVKGTPGRDAVDMTLTHEVLLKLATDLVDTIPP